MAIGPGLGTGKVGYWQTGVGVALAVENGSFALEGDAELGFNGHQGNTGLFQLEADADLSFVGSSANAGAFSVEADAELAFLGSVESAGNFQFLGQADVAMEGLFTDLKRFFGDFALEADADFKFFYSPGVNSGLSWVCVKDGVPKVGCMAHESSANPETGVRKRCNCG